MSVVFSGTNQGRFVSAGIAVPLQIRSDLDYMWVRNQTVSYAAGANTGAMFYWQRGYTQGRGDIHLKTAATNALQVGQIAVNSGFFLIDSSVNVPSAAHAYQTITGNTGAFNSPLVNSNDTANLPLTAVVGANNPAGVVRMYKVALSDDKQLAGLDFSVANVVLNTSFDLIYMDSIVNGTVASTYRIIPFDPIYYPTHRYITKVIVATAGTAAAGNPPVLASQAIVTLSVTHRYTIGQIVRFVVPSVTATTYGMTELNGLQGTIIAVGDLDADNATNTIRVDIDVSGFTAFAFPLNAGPAFTAAQTIPIGENTAEALLLNTNILGDATINQGYIGILLMPGTLSPAGVLNDVIYWVAGKSFSVDN